MNASASNRRTDRRKLRKLARLRSTRAEMVQRASSHPDAGRWPDARRGRAVAGQQLAVWHAVEASLLKGPDARAVLAPGGRPAPSQNRGARGKSLEMTHRQPADGSTDWSTRIQPIECLATTSRPRRPPWFASSWITAPGPLPLHHYLLVVACPGRDRARQDRARRHCLRCLHIRRRPRPQPQAVHPARQQARQAHPPDPQGHLTPNHPRFGRLQATSVPYRKSC